MKLLKTKIDGPKIIKTKIIELDNNKIKKYFTLVLMMLYSRKEYSYFVLPDLRHLLLSCR